MLMKLTPLLPEHILQAEHSSIPPLALGHEVEEEKITGSGQLWKAEILPADKVTAGSMKSLLRIGVWT